MQCACFMCLCRLTIYLLQVVLAYSCVAVRCTSPPTPVICLLSVVSRAELERQINGRIDACDYLCGAAWARGSTRRVSCGFFRDATSHLCGCLCLCLWLTVCLHLYVHHHTHKHTHAHSFLLFVCVYVCMYVCVCIYVYV